MGKFDKILICSDWDGTLFTGTEVPEESVRAIQYFQREGGLFTVCSGRGPKFLKNYSHFVKPNTYALCNNGALICDLESGEVIRRTLIEAEAYSAVDAIIASGANVKSVNISDSRTDEILHIAPEEYLARREELIQIPAYKVTTSALSEDDGLLMRSIAEGVGMREHCVVHSGRTIVEILRRDSMKGAAASLLKDITGARLLIGIGDYENDIDLVSRADIGYAVENAHEATKRAADRVTLSVNDCAVAHVIRDLEAEFTGK